MKYLLLAVVTLSAMLTTQQKTLTGKYKIIFEKPYESQNGNILFDKTTYVRKGTDGKAIKGTIDYARDVVILKDEKGSYYMEVSGKTIGQETVQFRTVDTSKKTDTGRGDMVFYPGKMIKMKDK